MCVGLRCYYTRPLPPFPVQNTSHRAFVAVLRWWPTLLQSKRCLLLLLPLDSFEPLLARVPAFSPANANHSYESQAKEVRGDCTFNRLSQPQFPLPSGLGYRHPGSLGSGWGVSIVSSWFSFLGEGVLSVGTFSFVGIFLHRKEGKKIEGLLRYWNTLFSDLRLVLVVFFSCGILVFFWGGESFGVVSPLPFEEGGQMVG